MLRRDAAEIGTLIFTGRAGIGAIAKVLGIRESVACGNFETGQYFTRNLGFEALAANLAIGDVAGIRRRRPDTRRGIVRILLGPIALDDPEERERDIQLPS